MIKRCKWCRHGIAAVDAEAKPYVVCALLPPAGLLIQDNGALHGQVKWTRPSMMLRGWCGQFRFGLSAFLGYGPRA